MYVTASKVGIQNHSTIGYHTRKRYHQIAQNLEPIICAWYVNHSLNYAIRLKPILKERHNSFPRCNMYVCH